MIRSKEVRFYPNQANNSMQDLVNFHRTTIGDFVASCLTFRHPSRVKAGIKYQVYEVI